LALKGRAANEVAIVNKISGSLVPRRVKRLRTDGNVAASDKYDVLEGLRRWCMKGWTVTWARRLDIGFMEKALRPWQWKY
jgi:hypothetical protein